MRSRALILLLGLAIGAPALADEPYDTEQRLNDWLVELRFQPRDPLVQAEVEELTHYESKAMGPSPEPHPAAPALVPVFDIASQARGTLQAWDEAERLGVMPRRQVRAKADGPAVIHYVQSAVTDSCAAEEVCTAIGVPVAIPVSSPTPVTGFRTYASLIAGLQALATQNSGVASFQSVGRTAGSGGTQRDIWAFRLGDADNFTAEGLPEPAFLQTGGIHAREWVAPEVVAAYAERLLARGADHGLYQYLLENVRHVLVPVLNVDGFLQTQRYPDRARQSDCAEDGSATVPRDGRLRRKNMNADGVAVDEDLLTIADATLGVDPNRNNRPWWGGTPGSSGTPCSLVYRGIAAESEREVDALQAAAALGPANRLRLYIDTHSYTRAYLAADTGNARRDVLQERLALRMSASAGQSPAPYGYAASSPGGGIGSTDEYFAYTYQIPAYTLEIEPRMNGLSDYPGGINVSNSGFLLPAAELPRIREEISDATVLGVYRQAGPPSVSAVQVRDAANAIVFSGAWQVASAAARTFHVEATSALQAGGTYTLWLAFNKPMRARDAGGAVVQYVGQSTSLAPSLSLQGVAQDGQDFSVPIATTAQGWRNGAGGAPNGFLRYADDAYAVGFTVPASTPLAGARRLSLSVSTADFSGQALDANPATAVDWSNGAWSKYEDADCVEGDGGGADRSARFIDDGVPLCGGGGGGDGGGGGTLGAGFALLGTLAAALRRRNRGGP